MFNVASHGDGRHEVNMSTTLQSEGVSETDTDPDPVSEFSRIRKA